MPHADAYRNNRPSENSWRLAGRKRGKANLLLQTAPNNGLGKLTEYPLCRNSKEFLYPATKQIVKQQNQSTFRISF